MVDQSKRLMHDSLSNHYQNNEAILDQIFLCDPVVLESICYRTRAKRLINDSKTTGGLRKIWTGSEITTRPNFFPRSSQRRVNLLSYESKTTYKWQQNNWRAKKNLDGNDLRSLLTSQNVCLQMAVSKQRGSSKLYGTFSTPFSGYLYHLDALSWLQLGVNGFPDSQLGRRFIVAIKLLN